MCTDGVFGRLQAQVGGLWDQAQAHPFVQALADGSLPMAAFSFYLKQDYVYLQAYARAIAVATARAGQLKLMRELAELLAATLGQEMQLHRDYCAECGLPESDLHATLAAPTCQAYADFAIALAAQEQPGALLAGLIPCGVGYAEIGQRLAARLSGSQQHPFRRWIETYSAPEYQQYAAWMIAALDELEPAVDRRRFAQLARYFTLGCRYEWMFWEMSWRQEQWLPG